MSAVPAALRPIATPKQHAHVPRPGFGFYHGRQQCPSYYRPYFVPSPVIVAPTVVDQPIVVPQPVVIEQPVAARPAEAYRMADAPLPARSGAAPAAYADAGLHAVALPSPTPDGGRPVDERLYRLMGEGTETFVLGRYEESARTFLQVMLEDPDNVDGALAYAVARFATGDYEMSALAIRRAVRRLCEVTHSDFDLRERYGQPEDINLHWANLVNALHHDPDHPDILVVLGFVQHFTGQRADAVATWEHIQALFLDDADVADCFLQAPDTTGSTDPAEMPGEAR